MSSTRKAVWAMAAIILCATLTFLFLDSTKHQLKTKNTNQASPEPNVNESEQLSVIAVKLREALPQSPTTKEKPVEKTELPHTLSLPKQLAELTYSQRTEALQELQNLHANDFDLSLFRQWFELENTDFEGGDFYLEEGPILDAPTWHAFLIDWLNLTRNETNRHQINAELKAILSTGELAPIETVAILRSLFSDYAIREKELYNHTIDLINLIPNDMDSHTKDVGLKAAFDFLILGSEEPISVANNLLPYLDESSPYFPQAYSTLEKILNSQHQCSSELYQMLNEVVDTPIAPPVYELALLNLSPDEPQLNQILADYIDNPGFTIQERSAFLDKWLSHESTINADYTFDYTQSDFKAIEHRREVFTQAAKQWLDEGRFHGQEIEAYMRYLLNEDV